MDRENDFQFSFREDSFLNFNWISSQVNYQTKLNVTRRPFSHLPCFIKISIQCSMIDIQDVFWVASFTMSWDIVTHSETFFGILENWKSQSKKQIRRGEGGQTENDSHCNYARS